MKLALLAVGTVVTVLACNDGTAPEKTPSPSTPPARAEPPPASRATDAAARPTPTLDVAIDGMPDAPPLAMPLKTQLGMRFISTKVLGFTEDQRAFVVKIDHNYFFGEEGQGRFVLNIYAVYDTWTGQMIGAFKRKISSSKFEMAGDILGIPSEPADRKYFESLEAVAKAAKPKRAWKAWLAANPLTPVRAERKGEHGEFSLTPIGKPSIGKVRAQPIKAGFRIRWHGLPSFEEGWKKKAGPELPKFEARWQPTSGPPRTLLSMNLGLDWAFDMARKESESAAVAGTVLTEVSSDNRRVFWSVVPSFFNINEGADPLGRLYLRSVGQQVKVVDAGAGTERARRVAAHLESKGITVAAVGKQDKPSPVSKVYYRRDSLDAARAVSEAMPIEVEGNKLESKGWVDVIVILGRDSSSQN